MDGWGEYFRLSLHVDESNLLLLEEDSRAKVIGSLLIGMLKALMVQYVQQREIFLISNAQKVFGLRALVSATSSVPRWMLGLCLT